MASGKQQESLRGAGACERSERGPGGSQGFRKAATGAKCPSEAVDLKGTLTRVDTSRATYHVQKGLGATAAGPGGAGKQQARARGQVWMWGGVPGEDRTVPVTLIPATHSWMTVEGLPCIQRDTGGKDGPLTSCEETRAPRARATSSVPTESPGAPATRTAARSPERPSQP